MASRRELCATIRLQQPATASGPAITVDTTSHLHAINPYIYGMNAFAQATGVGKAAGMTVDRLSHREQSLSPTHRLVDRALHERRS